MRSIICIASLVALLSLAGCAAAADTWPDRTNKSPEEMLADVIRWQQRFEVRESTGELAYECFTDLDFQEFLRNRRPEKVVSLLRKAPDFREIASALRTLPHESRLANFKKARAIALPTWAMMGYIDRTGHGQTEAGHRAELLIAAAVVDAFAAELGDK